MKNHGRTWTWRSQRWSWKYKPDCRRELQAKQPFQQPGLTKGCFECGKEGHFRKNCPQLKKGGNDNNNNNHQGNNNNQGNNAGNGAKGRAFVLGSGEARYDHNVVTGKFLLNNYFAYVLFDTSAHRSFMTNKLYNLLRKTLTLLEDKYTIEIADGQIIEATHVLKGCKLELASHKFDIDFMPATLGNFDVIVGMDWLSKNQAEIGCREKIVRLPLPNEETLSVQGERSGAVMGITSFLKAQKCLRKGHTAILALVNVDLLSVGLKLGIVNLQSYTDKRRKPLEFQVGDMVLLKVSPWKGVIRFRKQGKLNSRYVGPFKMVKRIGPVAYQLDLPEGLSGVHNAFHVSNLKICLANETLEVPLEKLHIDEQLRFVEEPVEIMDREIKTLKHSKIPIVRVRWNSKRGPKFTWEREDQMIRNLFPTLSIGAELGDLGGHVGGAPKALRINQSKVPPRIHNQTLVFGGNGLGDSRGMTGSIVGGFGLTMVVILRAHFGLVGFDGKWACCWVAWISVMGLWKPTKDEL
ncbi:hypothetical protein L1987_81218 [Smallanthus sonchifolius]|uniref:Uncharacterized protein n=1 Tax=Smallanthus sonchifolius TaxID=185202 RepID=A0ACB8YQZ0_9ASTR|nr:hypothetical protein L1987_81218 [Smallanthus sonchifolius]